MNRKAENQICSLCQSSRVQFFFRDNRRKYFHCMQCDFVFVSADYFLKLKEEKAVYDLHENSPDDDRYRHFLNRLFVPMNQRLPAKSFGFDFGSGPGPTLGLMFEEAGHCVQNYDPFYAPDISGFENKYDFITTTEVVEHLQNPQEELERLWACLKPDGWLGIMTKRVVSLDSFPTWHYKNDPTHICFYSIKTFLWLAKKWNAKLVVARADVVLFQKTS